ncbi:phospholipase D-like domain-containing protein [Spongiibacter taiwanensis]|uniref:phospholipase D-like domain-containing protein n=1 Tax=Spongiibacter taiwanensis TaxID=1748242 RepID=UPI0020365B3C|nr:phospholipase D-like domain-containing protein [Spongiibacter taiwanensis]USA43755.1 phospholipase D-like domain-containing protein [Spongiibacter taiwanensis]
MNSAALYEALFQCFRCMQFRQAKQIANDLTLAINNALLCGAVSIDTRCLPPELSARLSSVKPSPAIISVPWQAYRASQVGQMDMWLHYPELERILATAPAEYEDNIHAPWSWMQPNAGSLLGFMAALLFEAKEQLLIVNPYWSVDGVNNLKVYKGKDVSAPRSITVMTWPSPNYGDRAGLKAFCDWMEAEGSSLKILIPKPLANGQLPLVHAKVMATDTMKGYLGSANISENGLQRSIEAGVALQGPAVEQLRRWFDGIACNFEELDC